MSFKRTNLGQHIDLLTGYPFKSNAYSGDSRHIRLLRGDNVAQGNLRWEGAKYWPPEGADELNDYLLREGDIILAMDRPWIEAGLKYAAIQDTDLPCLLVQRVARLRGRDSMDTRFLKYVIGAKEFTNYILSVQTGTAVPHISPTQIKGYEFELPPISVQRAIAGILGALDDKIELNRKMNETLEAMARTIFKSWFIDFDPVRAKAEGRQPEGIDPETSAFFPNAFEDSTLGQIPKGWKIELLGNEVSITKGRSYKSSELAESRTALVTLKSFNRGGGYRHDGLKPYIGPYKPDQIVRPGELVVAFTDVTQQAEVIGKPAVVRTDQRFDCLVASLDVGIIRPLPKSYLSAPFLNYLLLTPDYQAHAYSHTSGTTVLHLAPTGVSAYRFVCPPSEISNRYFELVQPLNRQAATNAMESEHLAQLRDTLLPKLLSGEIRIQEAEKQVEAVV